jgi:hypothetical protein
MEIQFCECGCGEIPKPNRRFIFTHHNKGIFNPRWKGGKIKIDGYPHTKKLGNHNGYAPDHLLIVETILGKLLPNGAHIHHVNGDPSDNRNKNLVICQNTGYHHFVHRRTRAYFTCGHADWRKCAYCKKYDEPSNLYVNENHHIAWHKRCHADYEHSRRIKNHVIDFNN